jgi:hypothetical protein
MHQRLRIQTNMHEILLKRIEKQDDILIVNTF